MRIIVVGAVAAGTSAAAKARRNSEDAEIVIYEKGRYISYSGCGMPYFLGGAVEKAEELIPRDPAYFQSRYNVDVLTGHEVLAVSPDTRQVTVKNLATGETFADRYDRLVLATGASAVTPPIRGVDNPRVFMLRNMNDMFRIEAFLEKERPETAAVIGSGFVGLEMCENLKKRGLAVSLFERLPQVAPWLDEDMAAHVYNHITAQGVPVFTGVSVTEITPEGIALADGRRFEAGMVLISAGVRPETKLAAAAGVELGVGGAIRVDAGMRTSVPDIYACGDCIEQFHVVTGKPVWRPLGSTANKTGRIAGDNVTGGDLAFRGVLGTGICRVFDLAVAQTGLSERDARMEGYDVIVCHNIKPARPEYMRGQEMVIKAVADKAGGRLLGVQIVGPEGVDKRIDVFATAITFGAKAEDLFHLDLAYAPPYATTKDPVHYTGMILENALKRGRPLMTAQELDTLIRSGEPYKLIDARAPESYEKSHIETAVNIPHEKIRAAAGTMDANTVTVTYCNKGTTGNAAQNILLGKGFKKVYNLSGGERQFKAQRRGLRPDTES